MADESEYDFEGEGEYEAPPPRFPRVIDIGKLDNMSTFNLDDGIKRDIRITQEVFGEVWEYDRRYDVMRFTLENSCRDPIHLQVSSLGAGIVGIWAPDRKGIYRDVVLGFDDVDMYIGPYNPGFGRIMTMCPLPIQLEKTVWEWDFNRDEGSVIFSTMIFFIDLLITVKYTLTQENEIIVDMRASSAKILPISLTSQVYWNLKGHDTGEESMQHHALVLNSDKIWKFYNYKISNFIKVNGTKFDFRIPTLMDSPVVFGENDFDKTYVVLKGEKQKLAFLARLIHPRTCRYVEIFSDHPWMHCNTFNVMPRQERIPRVSAAEEEERPYRPSMPISIKSERSKRSSGDSRRESQNSPKRGSRTSKSSQKSQKDVEVDVGEAEAEEYSSIESEMPFLTELPGKYGCTYNKYGAFTVTPISDLTGFDPLVCAGNDYTHRIVYKLGVYRRYMKRVVPEEIILLPEGEDGLVDIDEE